MKWLVWACGLLLPALALAEPPQLQTHADTPALLYWSLSALAGDPHIDGPTWRAWWAKELPADARDVEAIAKFGHLKSLYRGRLVDVRGRTNPWVPVPPPPSYRLDVRFAALFLGARDLPELLRRAEVLLAEPDLLTLQQVVAVVGPRLQQFIGQAKWLAQFRSDFDVFSTRQQLPQFLDRVAQLLGATQTGVVAVHFVPVGPGQVLHGRRLGGHVVVEVRADDKPLHRSDVVAHEVVHWLQERAGNDDDPALIQALFGGGDVRAARAWELHSEGIATAIGQGAWQQQASPAEFERARNKPGGWYVDNAIEPYAKAIYPAVAAALPGSATLTALVPALLAGVDAVPAPRKLADVLHRYCLISDFRDAAWMDAQWWAAIPPRAVWRVDLEALSQWTQAAQATTLVVLATWSQLARLPSADAKVLGLPVPRKSDTGAATWLAPRSGGAVVLVVAAPDEAQLSQAAGAVASGGLPAPGWRVVTKSPSGFDKTNKAGTLPTGR